MPCNFTRRDFMKSSLYGLSLAAFPGQHAAAQTFRQRLDWEDFKVSRHYASFLDAIGKMRANTNASDKRSWLYWTNAHVTYCPHSFAYFLAWHRGYLYYFEQQLRAISGNNALTLPYWDYYKNPVIPAEFTNPASWNPLYIQRVNTDVTQALTLAPFADNVTNMQRGLVNAFETSLESMPHNPVHNIIGGVMSDMQSPLDPIFWVHHANIDRLLSAWVAADNGRIMPARTDVYWNGNFTYSTKLTLRRNMTVDTRTDMGYFYQNETLPTALPPTVLAEPVQLAMAGNAGKLAMLGSPASGEQPLLPKRPPLGNFSLSGPRPTGIQRRSIGGVRQMALNEHAVSARIPVNTQEKQGVQSVLKKMTAPPFGRADTSLGPHTSIQVVLDNVRNTPLGASGGYFYKIYLNLPLKADATESEEKYLLGNLGPFQVAGARHHVGANNNAGVQLVFPATQLLQNLTSEDLNELTVSFVRISGNNSPAGDAIKIGELRIEVSTDDVE